MATIAGTRPTHYELLGLTPKASDEEIRQAFAREISPFRPHAIGGLAEISIAYEALRDPARRRAYDSSIGIEPEPAPPPPRAEGWHHLGSVHVGPIAAPLPAAQPRPEPEAVRREAPAELDYRLPALKSSNPSVEDGAVEWQRPALVIGGLFAGVAVLGAGLGLYASRSVDPAQAEAPPVVAAPKVVAPAVEESPSAVAAQPRQKALQPKEPPKRIERRAPSPKPVETQAADDIPDIPTEQVAAQVAAAPETSTMPLSNGTIARTLGRIGYACGKVTSTAAVDGSPGVFSVTCSSGDSYRAAPVKGRYRFHRSH